MTRRRSTWSSVPRHRPGDVVSLDLGAWTGGPMSTVVIGRAAGGVEVRLPGGGRVVVPDAWLVPGARCAPPAPGV